jgi:hypothetical protein
LAAATSTFIGHCYLDDIPDAANIAPYAIQTCERDLAALFEFSVTLLGFRD